MIGVRLAQASSGLSLSPCRINYSRKVKLWYFGELRIWQFETTGNLTDQIKPGLAGKF